MKEKELNLEELANGTGGTQNSELGEVRPMGPTKNCPSCGSAATYFDLVGGKWHCGECGNTFSD